MKPTVFNYQEYEKVVEENKKLKAEVANLQIRCRIAESEKPDRDCNNCNHHKPDGCSRWDCEYEPVISDLIKKSDAIKALLRREERTMSVKAIPVEDWLRGGVFHIEDMPNAYNGENADRPTVDCTKFMEWLKAEVLDEENWELNAVANGEIICRKFRKLGWLDVEDGYYVDTRPTGEWIEEDEYGDLWVCDQCGFASEHRDNYCSNCGARMYKGGEDE